MVSKTFKLTPSYTPKFNKFLKKQGDVFTAVVQDEISDVILVDPLKGVQKSGDLSDFWIYKFKFKKQEFLIAYRFPSYLGKPDEVRKILAKKGTSSIEVEIVNIEVELQKIGSHENFYDELKKEIK
jgi:hypothetical protein